MGRTNEPEVKVCTTCKKEKVLTEFTANKSQKTGYMCYCKECNNERNKKYRKEEVSLERACKRIFSYLNKRARLKNFTLDFSYEYLVELYETQNGVCSYTKEQLNLSAGHKNTISVDRIDSSKGYTKDNVVLTTWAVNNCKQDLSMQDFVNLCELVCKNAKNKY